MTTISTTSSSMTMMREQVGGMLGGIDPRLMNNEYLKLLIAAMIMNALLSEDGGANQSGGQGMLQSLEGLTGGRNNALFMSLETSTNSVQIQQQSVRLDSVQAAQSTWQAGISDERTTGGQMDVCG
jgi:hypothetical protein